MQPISILACPQMEGLAEKIRKGRRDLIRQFDADVTWLEFENHFPNVHLNVNAIEDRNVWFLASFDNPAEIFRQLSAIYAIPRYGARSLTVVLPFFPTGTMDRVEEEGDVGTAKTLTRMLDMIPFSQDGPARIIIYDIHALQERFFFGDSVIPILKSSMPLAFKEFGEDKDWIVAFPDEGAQKRFKRYFNKKEQILCHKVRQGDKRIVTIKEGDPKGKRVLMVDDLVRTGGTLLNCAKLLNDAGAKSVDVFVPHSAFAPRGWGKFTEAIKKGQLRSFLTTDSCPINTRELEKLPGFRVLSLADTIASLMKPQQGV